jgi:hypothetical protein
MPKATISKRVLDTLIRAKLANVKQCQGFDPLPVEWRRPDVRGCNWFVPGWSDDADDLASCLDQVQRYLRVLGEQFEIPDES